MKLKSKLIATIVSICAAIAVMGVGVWAATGSFTVQVTNNINLSFANLAGDISVVGKAGADVTGVDGEDAQKTVANLEAVLYDYDATAAAGYEPVKFDAIAAAEVAEKTTKVWAGADFLQTYADVDTGYITEETKAAAIEYTFTYAKATTNGSGSINVALTQTGEDQALAGGATLVYSYYVSNDGGATWYPLADNGTVVKAGAWDDSIKVKAICQYKNPERVSVTVDTDWIFSLTFTPNSEAWVDGTDTLTGDPVEIGDLTAGAITIG